MEKEPTWDCGMYSCAKEEQCDSCYAKDHPEESEIEEEVSKMELVLDFLFPETEELTFA